MSDSVIREFLVRIGYEEHGRQKFNEGLGHVTAQAAEMAAAIKSAALAVEAAVGLIANSLEGLYFQAQRTGAAAAGIQALGFAATQVGSSVDAARASIESLGRFIWSNPGAENLIASLGVQTRDANGQLRQTDALMADIVRNLRGRPPAVAQAFAGMFGIDERILRAPGGEMDAQQARYDRMQRAAHFNVGQASRDAHFFMSELRTLGGAVGILQDKVASAFTRSMGEEINRFTIWLVDNFDKIDKVIRWVADNIVEAGHILTDFARDVWGWVQQTGDAWRKLDPDSQQLIKVLGGVAVAWKALNLVIELSPIGRLFLLGLAIAALVQEYQHWQAGAESIIPWEKWDPEITLALGGFKEIKGAVVDLWKALRDDLFPALERLFKGHGFEAGGHNWLQNQLLGLTTDLRRFIEESTDLVEIGAAIVNVDLPLAWRLIQKYNEPRRSSTELSPNDVGGTNERDVNGDLNRLPGEDDAAFFRRRGRDRLSQGLPFGAAADATRSLLSRWGVRFGSPTNDAHPNAGQELNTEQKRALAQESFDFWKARGFTDEGAAAAVAAESRESGGFNVAARGDPDASGQMTAHGVFQWHPGRRRAIFDATGINVSTATHAQQLEAAAREAELGLDPQWAAAYARARTARSFEEGSDAWVNGMLRPGDRQAALSHDVQTGRAFLPMLRRQRIAGPRVDPRVEPDPPPRPTTPTTAPRPGPVVPPPVAPPAPQAPPVVAAPVQPERTPNATPRVGPVVGPQIVAPPNVAGAVPPLGVGPQSSISNTEDNSRELALHQTNHITVQAGGESDGWAIGRSVMEAQRTLAQQTVRDMATAVS